MNHLSLFSGSGIGTLAAAACGIRTVAHAENDPACCYCLERLWPDARLFRDVRDVTSESVADLGPIDIISGGFPCVDISVAGRGGGVDKHAKRQTDEHGNGLLFDIADKRSGLWFEMLRTVRQIRPRWVLIENTPGLRTRGIDDVLSGMEEAGYTCWSLVVGAVSSGAPIRRMRIWIVAKSSGIEHQDFAHGAQKQIAGLAQQLPLAGGANVAEVPGLPGFHLQDTREARARVRMSRPAGTGRERHRPVWPSPPGYAQASWEPKRILDFGTNGMADGVHKRANEALLRMVGNGLVYPLAVILFQWIAGQHAN